MSVPAQGLTDIVPPGLLAVFDAEQLQEILGGNVITLRDVLNETAGAQNPWISLQ